MPILIVDDDKTVFGIVRRLLGQIGFKPIDETPDGMTALMKMTEKSYSLQLPASLLARLSPEPPMQAPDADARGFPATLAGPPMGQAPGLRVGLAKCQAVPYINFGYWAADQYAARRPGGFSREGMAVGRSFKLRSRRCSAPTPPLFPSAARLTGRTTARPAFGLPIHRRAWRRRRIWRELIAAGSERCGSTAT
jgi:hypothetical protein